MKVIVSTKGQVVIPQQFRLLLGIRPGDEVKVTSSDGRILMEKASGASARPRLRLRKGKMPVFQLPKESEPLTAGLVREIGQF